MRYKEFFKNNSDLVMQCITLLWEKSFKPIKTKKLHFDFWNNMLENLSVDQH